MPLVDESTNKTFVWYDESRQMYRRLGLTSHSEHLRRDDVSSREFFMRSSDAGPPYRQLSSKIASSPLDHLASDVSPHDWMLAARDRRYTDDVSATMWAGDAHHLAHALRRRGELLRAGDWAQGVCAVAAGGVGDDVAASHAARPPAGAAHQPADGWWPRAVANLGPATCSSCRRFTSPCDVAQSVAVSVTSKPEQGTRFDRACRLGLPVPDRTASPAPSPPRPALPRGGGAGDDAKRGGRGCEPICVARDRRRYRRWQPT